MTILMVLWFFGQSMHGYEVRFETPQACERAKAALEREAVRLNNAPPMALPNGQDLYPLPVRVSAVCAPAQ